MARSQARSKRKYTGKKYRSFRKKRKRELSRPPIETEIGKEEKKKQKTWGGNFKLKISSSSHINVTDPKTNKTQKTRILRFEENKASKDYNRRHILTKGAIIETEMGRVKITSRPGQHGQLNGLLLS